MNYKMTKEEDGVFRAQLLQDIPYFHEVYQKYRNPQSLEIAKTLGEISATLKNKWQKP